MILNIVNNQWAISTFQDFARGRRRRRSPRAAYGFGIPALRVDGNDYLAVYARAHGRRSGRAPNLGPTLIEWVTLPRGRALDLRRSFGVPARRRGSRRGRSATRSSGCRAPGRRRRVERRRARDAAARASKPRSIAAQQEAESHGTLQGGVGPVAADIFEDVYKRDAARIFDGNVSRRGTDDHAGDDDDRGDPRRARGGDGA